MFIYPENLKAKPMLWLWELRDIGIIGVGFLLSVLALSQGAGMIPLVITVLFRVIIVLQDCYHSHIFTSFQCVTWSARS